MGPDKFTTEFEKTLVVSMVAPIVSPLPALPPRSYGELY